MRLFTYSEIEAKVRLDLDLQDANNFVQNDEFAGYANEAIQDAESEILKLNEDYFLSNDTMTLASGTQDYDLPLDIWGQKIRSLIYKNGSLIYPIMRIRDPHEFYKKHELDTYATSGTEYSYILRASTAGAQAKIVFSPSPTESGAYVQRWYIRKANRIPLTTDAGTPTRATQLATVIDIPEWASYIMQFMKYRAYEKEFDPRMAEAKEALISVRKSMVESLTEKVPDNDNQVPMDLGFYSEHN